MRIIAIIVCAMLGLAYVFNSNVLLHFYNIVTHDDWHVFDTKRHLVYEFMFAGFFWLTYALSNKGDFLDAVLKSIACLFMILAFGSAIDKCFGITTYLKSDILLIIISIAISVYVFIRERKHRD